MTLSAGGGAPFRAGSAGPAADEAQARFACRATQR